MDYVLGGVAALLTGNVTPNRPKVLKRALTPMKHQLSPNVTPKSESVTDRSIFLSPTMQKKKAIVKKSPKRIFQNPDTDSTSEVDGNSSFISPKADKVKKHLKDELDGDIDIKTILSPKSPKNKLNKSVESQSKKDLNISADVPVLEEIQVSNESTPKKKKKKLSLVLQCTKDGKSNKNQGENNQDTGNSNKEIGIPIEKATPKKRKHFNQCTFETIDSSETQNIKVVTESCIVDTGNQKGKKKLKKCTKDIVPNNSLEVEENVSKENVGQIKGKKAKKNKKNASKNVPSNLIKQSESGASVETAQSEIVDKTDYINPNAITNQDSDSEHESDDNIESENEETNKAVLNTGPVESSDDEQDEEKNKKANKSNKEDVEKHVETEEEVKRTLFVGNVPFSGKCKKEIKRIFDKYGEIETVRIRTVPVKDARVTPKLAVIKNELHPDRSTVNVYIKYAHPSSVENALVENNTVVNGNHLRVARSDVTGSEHDPRCAVFVGNLPFALEDEALRAKFEGCGEIQSVRIVRDRKTNAGKGFGYVNFASKDGVELALALTEEDLTIKNRILRVNRCTQLTTNKKGRQQNNQGRQQSNQGRQQNFQGRQQNFQGRQQNFQGRQQNQMQGRQFNNKEGQMNRSGNNQFGNNRFQRKDQSMDSKNDGAYRRLTNKRKPQDSNEGPPQKRPKNLNQPITEKKPRKDFVGVTAGKKKFQKRKVNKDQRKKKALSEILTKSRQ